MYEKYTKPRLETLIKESSSWAEVCRKLQIKEAGGSQAHLKYKAIKYAIDYSHFKSRAWAKNITLSNKKRTKENILVLSIKGNREKAYLLRRALQESLVEYKCSICSISNWLGKDIILEIDHIDGNYKNNRIENLRFLCHNCHSQTINYKNKAR